MTRIVEVEAVALEVCVILLKYISTPLTVTVNGCPAVRVVGVPVLP